MESGQLLVVGLAGAAAPILIALIRKPLASKIAASHEFEFEWGTVKLRFKGSEADLVLAALIREMRALIDKVPVAERKLILSEVEARDGRVLVRDIFPDFERETTQHTLLRDLRDAQFIRPKNSGQFHKVSVLEMKPFGRLMLQYQREYIFDERPKK